MELVVDNTLVVRAERYAEKKFAGIYRPNKARTPLIYHSRSVAELVVEARGTEIEVAAAWLHDTIEYTDATIEEIQDQFGRSVALVVEGLTDDPAIATMGTLERKMHQVRKLMYRSPSVKLVKHADGIVNLRSVTDDPPMEWDGKKCQEYIQGCWHVGQVCFGISPVLDKYFIEAHQAAQAKHSYA